MMFEGYSLRAAQVLMLARVKAGGRGAETLDIEDLLAALLIEDQGGFNQAHSELLGRAGVGAQVGRLPRESFLPPDIASAVLARVEALCARSRPIPTASDIPLSEGAKHALAVAATMREELRGRKIEPLHMLAAIAGDESSRGAQILREAGITREGVLSVLRKEALSKNEPGMRKGPQVPAAPPVYSKRGHQILSLAHFKSRARGSPVIEIEDLLAAFLIEDQGEYVEAKSEICSEIFSEGMGIDMNYVDLGPRRPFLPSALAHDLLARVEALCSRSEPLTWRAFKSLSSGAKHAVDVADLLREALRQSEIEPLHLLAAIVGVESSPAGQMLRDAGITRDSVLRAVRGEAT